MLKRSLIAIALLAVGLYIGFSLPRGAGLIATLMNLTSDRTGDYSSTASHS